MIKSMTGFGRGTRDEGGIGFVIEIKSVNHRYLDLNIKMPRSLNSLEDKIKKIIIKKVSRGKIDVFITQNKAFNQNEIASLNTVLADSYIKCLQDIKERYKLIDDISVSLIAKFPDVVQLEQQETDIDKVWEVLVSPLNNAVDDLVAMRIVEGEKLKEDIFNRCELIGAYVTKVEGKASTVVVNYREKLNNRIKELLKNVPVDENRIATEVAIYADKASIDEEIVRLRSHLSQVSEALALNEPVGRKLDFIVQEMNREANTIASKADDLDIVNFTLNIKSEIEKIREQIQNIE